MIGVVGVLIVLEVSAHVLDVEAGLVAGVEPLDQLFQGRLAGDDHELVARGHEPFTPIGAKSWIPRRRGRRAGRPGSRR